MTTLLRDATAVKLGKRADFKAIINVLQDQYTITKLPEVLQITPKHTDESTANEQMQVCFVLKNGVVMSWNLDRALTTLREHADNFVLNPTEKPVTESIQYILTSGEFEIAEDVFIIPENDMQALLSISYAISKSLQIEATEQKVTEVMRGVQNIPNQLSHKGHTLISGKRIKKTIGSILDLQFTISTAGLAEDRPDIFWDEPRLVNYYTKTAVYLELDDRWNVLSEKIQALYTTVELLRDEVNTKHSHRLEWIIILLIVFEIVWAFISAAH